MPDTVWAVFLAAAHTVTALVAARPVLDGDRPRQSFLNDLGHSSMIHQGEATDHYGVSQSQISSDLSRLADHVDTELGSRQAIATDAVFKRAIRGLLEDGDYRDAARTAKEWNDWLTEYQGFQELEERIAAVEARRGDEGSRL